MFRVWRIDEPEWHREEGILVLSGGLTAHNLRDRRSFTPTTATEAHKAFDSAIHSAIRVADVSIFCCASRCSRRSDC
jgi:aromatic ring-opening dioxygenase catalytic subunit (LigB family)